MYQKNTVNSVGFVNEKVAISPSDIPELVGKIKTIRVTNPGNLMA